MKYYLFLLLLISPLLLESEEYIPPHYSSLPKKVLLLNDTSAWYHWGCTGTASMMKSQIVERGYSLSSIPIQYNYTLKRIPQSKDFDDPDFFEHFKKGHPRLVQELDSADLVVVNGEGTLHGMRPGPMKLLYLAYIAKTRFGKHVEIINHSVYPNDSLDTSDSEAIALYAKVYRAMDFVAVRERESAKILNKLGIAATESFDCLPLYIRSHYHPKANMKKCVKTILVEGSVDWTEEGMRAVLAYLQEMKKQGYQVRFVMGAKQDIASDDIALSQFLQRYTIPLINATSMDQWLDEIRNASLLVSGRFHCTIAAACLGTPFIALNSNTPKVEALHPYLPLVEVLRYSDPELRQKLHAQTKQIFSSPPHYDPELINRLCMMAEKNFIGLERECENIHDAVGIPVLADK